MNVRGQLFGLASRVLRAGLRRSVAARVIKRAPQTWGRKGLKTRFLHRSIQRRNQRHSQRHIQPPARWFASAPDDNDDRPTRGIVPTLINMFRENPKLVEMSTKAANKPSSDEKSPLSGIDEKLRILTEGMGASEKPDDSQPGPQADAKRESGGGKGKTSSVDRGASADPDRIRQWMNEEFDKVKYNINRRSEADQLAIRQAFAKKFPAKLHAVWPSLRLTEPLTGQNPRVYIHAITLCEYAGAWNTIIKLYEILDEGKTKHRKNRMNRHFVCTVAYAYGKVGEMEVAERLAGKYFDNPLDNLAVLISAYCGAGKPELANELTKQMLGAVGIEVDIVTKAPWRHPSDDDQGQQPLSENRDQPQLARMSNPILRLIRHLQTSRNYGMAANWLCVLARHFRDKDIVQLCFPDAMRCMRSCAEAGHVNHLSNLCEAFLSIPSFFSIESMSIRDSMRARSWSDPPELWTNEGFENTISLIAKGAMKNQAPKIVLDIFAAVQKPTDDLINTYMQALSARGKVIEALDFLINARTRNPGMEVNMLTLATMAVFLKGESERLRAFYRLLEAHKNGRKIPPVALAILVLANQGDPSSARSMLEEAHRFGISWADCSLADETRIVLVSLRLAAAHGDWRQISLLFSGKLREQLTYTGVDPEEDASLLRDFRAFAIDYVVQGLLYGGQFNRAVSVVAECKRNVHPHTMRLVVQAMRLGSDANKSDSYGKEMKPYLNRMISKYPMSIMRPVTKTDIYESVKFIDYFLEDVDLSQDAPWLWFRYRRLTMWQEPHPERNSGAHGYATNERSFAR